jgi:hypothetical protein
VGKWHVWKNTKRGEMSRKSVDNLKPQSIYDFHNIFAPHIEKKITVSKNNRKTKLM